MAKNLDDLLPSADEIMKKIHAAGNKCQQRSEIG